MPIRIREAWADALALLLPAPCAACDRGGRPLCDACAIALSPEPHRSVRGRLPVWCGLDYAGPAARALAAFKDSARTDAAPALVPALKAALRLALSEAGDGAPIVLVPVPSRPAAVRGRGFRHVELLLRRAGLPAVRALRSAGRRHDQAGLGRVQRLANADHAFRARPGIRLEGRRVLLVDDIVTTGATVQAAAAVLRAAGASVVGAIAVAETRRRS